ncbi:hypothetical protein MA16_Dca001794 [Dendrobium catenatum]|uniref:Metallo-beta-lactamase domain-containing protein n=2 Tax=Dendrobium catenatum TaxID=906689 RepID=A0A2I0XDI7_9ASPA|nr:hypothetical protein MA16_Dca001794 [Dendrobium catenatum]
MCSAIQQPVFTFRFFFLRSSLFSMVLAALSFAQLPGISISRASPDSFPCHRPSSLLFPLGRRRLTLHSDRNQSLKASSSSSISSSTPGTKADAFELTYLEGNSWLWNTDGVNVLVDPILVGNLDFGVPWLYDAAKKVLTTFRLENLPAVDCLLITQSLDDHCHVKTLRPLSEKHPNLPVFSTPNAESILRSLFRNVTYLEPGQTSEFEGRNGGKLNILATAGPILGPPWQRPENGYIITSRRSNLKLYYEPHCVYNKSFLKEYKVDILITPVIKQLLPSFTLVSGQEDAVHLAKLLQAKYIVPMKNGDLNGKGFLSSIIRSEGTVESFKELLKEELPDAHVLEPQPGVPLEISMSSSSL